MRSGALKKTEAKESPPRRGALRAVQAKAATRPAIKVYTGSAKLKERIEQAARDDRPGQSASSFLLGLFWKHQKRQQSHPSGE